MPSSNRSIAVSLDQGTPVFDITAGVKTPRGMSISWSTVMRPDNDVTADARVRAQAGAACPSLMDTIAVAQTFDAASKFGKLKQIPGVVSSSFSSPEVAVINVDDNGNGTPGGTIPFVFIPKFHTSTEVPGFEGQAVAIAEEIWFSNVPFASVPAGLKDQDVKNVENICNENVGPSV